MDRELSAAQALRGPRTFLLVGNSLLLAALSDTQVARLAPSGWDARRLVVEQTSFLDWKYGLAELRRRGAQPAVFGVMLDPGQLTSVRTRSGYAALRMLGAADVVPMGLDAHLHPTEISRLVLSHYSTFYGFRSESRNILLGRLIPGMPALVRLFTKSRGGAPDTVRTRRVARERLATYKRLVEAADACFLFVQPPLTTTAATMAEVRAVGMAAADVGVAVVTFDPDRPYEAGEFADGYHLNTAGSRRYFGETSERVRRAISGFETGAGSREGRAAPRGRACSREEGRK